MPTVRFLQDFQGVETGGVFYRSGQTVEVSTGVASRCVADKRAELVKQDNGERVTLIVDEVETSATVYDIPPVEAVTADAPVMTTTNQASRHNKRGR